MKIHDLITKARKSKRRIGRGIAAGRGKTAGRGTKGQNSRSGGRVRPGFEGGQNPLYARIPKIPGFTSKINDKEEITTGQLEKTFNANSQITTMNLAQAKLISSPYSSVKLIYKGELTKKFKLEIQAVSSSAKASLVKAGGSVSIVDRSKRGKLEKVTE
jgi:large subunit ribosomal protein L15